jgi:mannose-6-phosphate isomerase
MPVYPLRFTPVYKDYLWGGTRIPRRFGRAAHPAVCAESWEVSTRAEGESVVCNGPLAGTALGGLARSWPSQLTGAAAADGKFPLLVKLIDAEQALSVQVHPDGAGAARYGGEPKTEMWYVLEAAPGARIFAGLKAGTTPDRFAAALRDGHVPDLLRTIPARAGLAVFVPGGRVHAIGAGCLVLEVQQNSNTTYRVYDWDRKGADGKPRELHVEQALRIIDWQDAGDAGTVPTRIGGDEEDGVFSVVSCEFFRVLRLDLSRPRTVPLDGRSCHILFTASGRMEVEAGGATERMEPGATGLIPASAGTYGLAPVGGPASVLQIGLC